MRAGLAQQLGADPNQHRANLGSLVVWTRVPLGVVVQFHLLDHRVVPADWGDDTAS